MLSPSNPQPGLRPPAPGQLALVQAFLNTHFDLRRERWGDEVLHAPAALSSWLLEHDLLAAGSQAGTGDLALALRLRRALRETVARPGDPRGLAELSGAARSTAATVEFAPTGPRFVPAAGDGARGGLGVIATVSAAAMRDGSWSRLKLCPGEHCGWAFYDQSRNRSGRWCSMTVCGGRTKARAHYARTRAREGAQR